MLTGGLLLPPGAFAQTPAPTPLLDAARAAAARQVPRKTRSAAQTPPATTAPATDLRSGSFFKSAAGIATIAIFGAGVGYAIYSASNDRIKGTGR